MKIIRLLFVLCFCSGQVIAAGPEKVATIDRDLWPEAIDSQQAFDRASAAEILQFTNMMSSVPLSSESEIKTLTGLKQVNLDSVLKWREKTQRQLLQGYRDATGQTGVERWEALVRLAHERLPALNSQWQQASAQFYRYYLFEQVRLAALFPRISSEILTYDENEVTGDMYADGEFLLTFDDGPHPTRTKPLIKQLTEKEIHATFFVLGHKLSEEKNKGLYQNQCLGSHGWRHRAHKDLSWSKTSVEQTDQALASFSSLNAQKAFRPPYGMRTEEISAWLRQQGHPIYLWNIDSQDWNTKLSAKQVTDRVITLMLLRRKGMILFHDIHPKANLALPALDHLVNQAGLKWRHCL
ncbi:polysaccharide deacetylase family protein [Photobacterium galatheae]|uniref:polysaccharide deacetylase family protein n=1 Tax=Photobacterium galatheae TaxID=1654360 RepID=UPI00202CBDDE|nr:polysaccharide deacetylase family protein [Photobacterium galatheae]MCM0148686.1 polysaccharide deacetylase family protein [Photobacterium galatheae]